jgi:hypothetical protein
LDRVLERIAECLTPDVSAKLVAARADQLTEKANEGALLTEERAEYDRYREAFHFVTSLQAKARKLLTEYPTS